jgi:hypothetical protein
MAPYQILISRLETLNEEMNRVDNVLDSMCIDKYLQRSLCNKIKNKINEGQISIENLKGKILASEPTEMYWNEYKAISNCCEAIIRECYAFIGGMFIREKLDNGLYEITDALLKTLSDLTGFSWNNCTLLDTEEYISDISDAITMRFTEYGIWNMSIVGHEFGHFVSKKLFPTNFLVNLLREEDCELPKVNCQSDQIDEYFSDLFALYTLGPAYVFNCILLRFDPFDIETGDESHPDDVERAYFLLQAMQILNEEKRDSTYDYINKKLVIDWQKSLSDFQPEIPETNDNYNCLLKCLYSQLIKKLKIAKYDSWNKAVSLSYSLPSLNEDEFGTISGKGYSIRDVLNSAWICHIQLRDQRILSRKTLLDKDEVISKNAIELCRRMIQ